MRRRTYSLPHSARITEAQGASLATRLHRRVGLDRTVVEARAKELYEEECEGGREGRPWDELDAWIQEAWREEARDDLSGTRRQDPEDLGLRRPGE